MTNLVILDMGSLHFEKKEVKSGKQAINREERTGVESPSDRN